MPCIRRGLVDASLGEDGSDRNDTVQEGGSDSEADGEELAEVESRLRQLAPELPQPGGTPAPGAAELRQLPFTTEALQAPEVLFQPR